MAYTDDVDEPEVTCPRCQHQDCRDVTYDCFCDIGKTAKCRACGHEFVVTAADIKTFVVSNN